MDLYAAVARNFEEMISSLRELISIPSVRDNSVRTPGAPFGKEVADALDWYLAKARDMGFKVKNVDGYAGHVEYGAGEELLGILVHLDVVPPGTGWDSEPFGGEIKDGKLYGRGVMDNKGPAVMALYALKVIKESGVKINKRIRIIAGCDEESGMECMDYYFKHEEMPKLGFTPDADFPMIYAEKGILHLKAAWSATGPCLNLTGGVRPNVVPQAAEAELEVGAVALDQIDLPEGVAVEFSKAGARLTASGKAAHASTPENGVNAIVRLLQSLTQFELGAQSTYIKFLAEAGAGSHGEGLAVELADDISGKLTCNLGMIKLENGMGEVIFDIRSPVTLPLEETARLARAALEQAGFSTEIHDFQPPHMVPKDSELVQTLLGVYREFTGDMGEPLAIGGGTYARKIKGAVAFGPLFPGREDVAHIANEFMSLEDIKLCTEIYAKSILTLASKS
ncbi:MAG TPA: dipeptidase PepV [Verrucomicrobiae bacterium]|nr:dipeptidase PepV [Verrucomicrobiae bacterium]